MAEFEKVLTASGRSVVHVNGRYEVVNPITEAEALKIKALCDAFEVSKHTSHYKAYKLVRLTQVKNELKEFELANSTLWTVVSQDGPYERGSHPFKEYYFLVIALLRSELQLWVNTLPTNVESLGIFVSICSSAIEELQRVLIPVLSDIIAIDGKQSVNPTVQQTKLCLIRLDILDVFVSRFDEIR